jgi:hypothetical protein
MAGFRIRESEGEKRLYGGDEYGWIQDNPPPPPNPSDQAKVFATQEEADAFIKKFALKAAAEAAP